MRSSIGPDGSLEEVPPEGCPAGHPARPPCAPSATRRPPSKPGWAGASWSGPTIAAW